MTELKVKRKLNDRTRQQEVWVAAPDSKIAVFSLHITDDEEVVITDSCDYKKIYAIYSLDYYNALCREEGR